MKPTTTSVQTVSTVANSAQVMGIDAEGMGTILSILSNMYSDGSLAVVREYSSNALDSHIEAGNPDPILITSPSHFNPVFTVQDFGTGLSRDEVLNVYAKYGASTKRETDEQIGAFGIGAKSAFTVGTQFTVTAVKDGFETIALFALNESGAPTVNIISYREDQLEPNGVKVEVGVKDVDGVNRAIKRIFSTWKSGTVLIDGVQPNSIWDSLSPLADDVHLGWREDRFKDDAWTVVMGGIPYELPSPVKQTLTRHAAQIVNQVSDSLARIYLTVPIGAVDITPSREELRVTQKTTDAVSLLVEKFGRNIGPWISDQISGAKSMIEAIIQKRAIDKTLGAVATSTLAYVTWHGKPLASSSLDVPNAEWFELRRKRGNYYGEKIASRVKELRVHPSYPLERFLFVTDVPEGRVRSVQLAAKAYLQEQDRSNGMMRVIALTAATSSYKQEWFDLDDPALAKTDFTSFVKEWKPAVTPGQRGETRYEISSTGAVLTAAELANEDQVYYMTPANWKLASNASSILRETVGDATLVILKSTQKAEVLVRKVPGVIDARQAMEDHASKVLADLTQDDIDTITATTYLNIVSATTVSFLIENRKKITNPVVLKFITQYERAQQLRDNNFARMRAINLAARFLGRQLEVSSKSALNPADWEKLSAGLPLLGIYFEGYRRRTSLADQHVIDYINSVNL